MNKNESAAASALVASGMRGRTWAISQRIAPEVLAAAVAGTNPGTRRWR
jgi:hypothetical protein